jgi:hypothetical protein
MKKLLLAGLLLAGLGAQAQNLQKVDADYGFHDIKLGSATSAYPEMIYTGLGADNDPDLRYYERRGEILAFEGVPLSSVRYAYYKGKLGSIVLETNAAHKVALRKAMLARYGKSIRWPKAYEWNGQHATIVLLETDAAVSSVLIATNEFKRMRQARMK